MVLAEAGLDGGVPVERLEDDEPGLEELEPET